MTSNVYSDFNDVEDEQLRTFNRCITIMTINKDAGETGVIHYLSGFPEDEKKRLYEMFLDIEDRGESDVRRDIIKGLQ